MNRKSIGRLARRIAWSVSSALVVLLFLTFAACGGGGGTGQQSSGAGFYLEGAGTLRPLVTAGTAIPYNITANPRFARSSDTGMIAVTLSGIPSGLTISPDSFSVDPTSSAGQVVTITADSSLSPNSYPVTVTGTREGQSYSITVTVGVVEPTPAPTPLQASLVYSFNGASDGGAASGSLIPDSAGNLYGVTYEGGTYELGGTVFKLSYSNGSWQKAVLYSFDDGQPLGALVLDGAGNLYGVTGETGNLCNPNGCSGASNGTVYELTPTGSGWQRTILHTFSNSPDGSSPGAGLVMDKAGNLYGTTKYGGDVSSADCMNMGGCGTVFTVTRSGTGWTYSVIHNFEFSDGASPQSELVVDPQGNIYGTTFLGGDLGCPWLKQYAVGGVSGPECGTVFEMTLSGGVWGETTIYTFHASYEGTGPLGLVLDAAGNLYGVTTFGGFDTSECAQCGNFFKLTPSGNGWTLSQVYEFLGGNDGAQPFGNVVRDQAGNIYGLTANGGPPNCGDAAEGYYGCGTIVRLSPTAGLGQTGQGWVATGYYDFPGGAAGSIPWSLTLSGGQLFGITQGGSAGNGVIFEISP